MFYNPMQPQMGQGYPPAYSQPRQPQANMDWIRVPNVSDVDQVSVQANQTAWIMAQNANVFAVRMADQMGMTTTRFFRFEEFDPRAANAAKENDFEARLTRLEELAYGTKPTRGHYESPAAVAEPAE